MDATAGPRMGDAATEIIAAAAAWDADLIVSERMAGWASAGVPGSVARNALHHAAASFLVGREGPGPS
jgi:nucleotide-binding universal stress UspA family protein